MAELETAAQTAIPEAPFDSDNRSLAAIVGRLAHAIDKILGTGEVADLRRLRPNDPSCPAFWKTLAEYWDLPYDDDDAHLKASLLSGLARTKGLFDFHIGIGKSLALADYSELRFVRLLRAEGKSMLKEIELMAEFLNSKAQKANWAQVAELLFTHDEEKTESLRRRIARDYYGTQNKKKEK